MAKLLLVDEDDRILTLIGDYLSSRGHEVYRAHQNEEAQALLNHFKFSAVITGLKTSGTDAEEQAFLARISGLHPLPATIFLSQQSVAERNAVAVDENTSKQFMIERPVSILHLDELVDEIHERELLNGNLYD
jgi:DNA-binding response OmpR family regulator